MNPQEGLIQRKPQRTRAEASRSDRLAFDYHYGTVAPSHTTDYLLPAVLGIFEAEGVGKANRIFELGCGNGAFAAELVRRGYKVEGVDPSIEGIAIANREHPDLKLSLGSAYDDLRAAHGTFPVAISLEVVEHLYAPRVFAKTLVDLLEPGGVAILSTPYHGYLKNLALALTGRLDAHLGPLWDHGHIKFWSMRTLGELLREAGFATVRFERVGRIPVLAKSMIAIARKAATTP